MNNLSTREKVLIYVVILLLIVGIVYVAVLRPLGKAIDSANAELDNRKSRLEYLDALKASNESTKDNISKLEKDIKAKEGSLFAHIDGDVVADYVMRVFESSNCPYLSEIKVEDIPTSDIYLPDGSMAAEKLVLKRVYVEYATTDGFTIPEFNKKPAWYTGGTELEKDLITDAVAHMGDPAYYQITGYTQFIDGLKTIANNDTYKNCIKVHSVTVEDSTTGFLYLRAEIDCYGTDLGSSRILAVKEKEQVKIEWDGDENVDCSGGMIGVPLFNFNEKNSFYMYQIAGDGIEEFSNRPYCSYFSNAMMVLIYKQYGTLYEDPFEKIPYQFEFEFADGTGLNPANAGEEDNQPANGD
ncbi:MAG: type II secretion system protein M [Clostridiales bacterium]|nr:type II secretion system protein M [Clostridiales bacterium]